MKALDYTRTPTIDWKDERLPLRIRVRLECNNHPFVSGNKWWKLKYNIAEAQRQGSRTLLTFGGPYSNHVFATAAAARELDMSSIGIIRGERVSNPTLDFAERCGMRLHFVSREEYKSKNDSAYAAQLERAFGDFYLVPEGGTNENAIKGCSEFGSMLHSENDFDTLCLPVGTGGTMAGLIRSMALNKSVIGFSALKGGAFLADEIRRWIDSETCTWRIETSYHFGGYARRTRQLEDFIALVRATHGISLDPVYTSKMMFGVIDLARRGTFPKGSNVLAIHTGGLQLHGASSLAGQNSG
jgi:1-aminocyclopropane-1-carboxylate deaminase